MWVWVWGWGRVWRQPQYSGGTYTTTVYVNGTENAKFLHTKFCGDHVGSLVFAQEQDTVGGSFDVTQATDAIIDTVAMCVRAMLLPCV